MKTRSAVVEAPNIAAIVKARHLNINTVQPQQTSATAINPLCFPADAVSGIIGSPVTLPGPSTTSATSSLDDTRPATASDYKAKTSSTVAPKMLRGVWSPDDRRLFFQAVRLFGRNFTDVTRYIRCRGNRNTATASLIASLPVSTTVNVKSEDPNFFASSSTSSVPVSLTGVVSTSNPAAAGGGFVVATTPAGAAVTATMGSGSSSSAMSAGGSNVTVCGGPTKEQVRFFYQQTWHKVRRYIKFPDDVSQRVREVYGIINYSVIRNRIKKPLDHRLGEKLNELVNFGTTMIKHNGRRFVLCTPTCPALKQLNHITAPTHEFLLPEDVWVELVPYTQADAWHVLLESEQNPRLRLRVDINRQLSDVLNLVEKKWQSPAERMQSLFDLPAVRSCPQKRLIIRSAPNQPIDGAIRIHEIARVRSGDVSIRAFLRRKHASSSNFSSNAVHDPARQTAGDKSTANQVSGDPPDDVNHLVSSPAAQPSGTAAPPTQSSASSASVELDLREVGQQLSRGVTYEGACGIKLVALFLALGCPDRIRFEYTYSTVGETANEHSLTAIIADAFHSGKGNDGIGNGLRRLLHLNASDYLLHRDWISRHSIPTKTTPAVSSLSSATTATTPAVMSCNSSVVNANVSLASSPSPSTTITMTTVATSPQPVPYSGAALSYLPSCLPPLITPRTPVGCRYTESVNNLPPPISSSLQAATTNAFNSNVVLLGQAKNQLCVIERQLDHRPKPTIVCKPNIVPPSITPSTSLRPLRIAPAIAGSRRPPLFTAPGFPINSLASISFVQPSSQPPAAPVCNSEMAIPPQPSSSLSAVKAFNVRRRTSGQVRCPRPRYPSMRPSDPIAVSPIKIPPASGLDGPFGVTTRYSGLMPHGQPVGDDLSQFAVNSTNHPNPVKTPVNCSNTNFSPHTGALLADPSRFSLFSPSPSVEPSMSPPADTSLLEVPSAGLGVGNSADQSWSSDTLASLLSSIYQHQQHQNPTTDLSATPADVRVLSGSTHRPPQQHTDWLGVIKSECVSTSCDTPHLPLSSPPAFTNDISLTDSMAAVVMNTHQVEFRDTASNDTGQMPSEPYQTANEHAAFMRNDANQGHSMENEIGGNNTPSAVSTFTESSESTVDLNLLLNSLASDNPSAADSKRSMTRDNCS